MKKLAIVLASLLLLGVAGALIGLRVFTSGTGGFDDWIVRRVVAIAEVYLVPNIRFDSFRYADGGVTLKGVQLVAPDGTSVVDAGSLRVTFAGIPTPKTGLVMQSVEIENASLHLIRSADGGFKGLVPFVETQKVTDQQSVEEDMRLGSAFQIRKIVLKNCALVYDPAGAEPPMRLDDINLDMDVQPAQDAGAGSHVYALDTTLDRAPVLTLDVKGTLDLDALALDLASLSLSADLANKQAVAALPPQLQTLLREHDARGRLAADASGHVSLDTPLDSTLNANVALDSFNVAAGEYRVPIESGNIAIALSNRLATIDTATLHTCQGVVDAGGSTVRFDGAPGPSAALRWNVSGFQLQDLLRTASQGEPPKLAGLVATSGSADVSSLSPLALAGDGRLEIREGRLIEIPTISGLARMMNVLAKLSHTPKFHDTADATFTLTDTALRLDKVDVETDVLAARGKGTIGYDGALDLLVNAGPLEKIQNAAGIIGDIVGSVTDRLVKYDVEGRVGDPKIKVRPLGLGG